MRAPFESVKMRNSPHFAPASHGVPRACCLAALLLAGCATTGPYYVPAKEANVSLSLFGAAQASESIDPTGTKGLSLKDEEAHEKQVVQWCGGNPDGVAPALGAGVVLWLVDQGLSYFVNEVDDALQREVALYTASFKGDAAKWFYVRDTAQLTLQSNCFRLTRQYDAGNNRKAIAMDLIGRMEITDNAVLVVRPLRLFYSKAAAATDQSGQLGVAVSVKMNSIWRDTTRGKAEEAVVNLDLLTEKVTLKSDGKYFYALYPPGNSNPSYAALPPWSAGTGNYASWTTTTVTVAEAGNVPWLLKNAAKLFHDNKDTVTQKLQDAAKKVISP